MSQYRSANRKSHDSRRGTASERGYGYAWQTARDQFLRDNPLCADHASRGRHAAAEVVDHIVAPRLREARESGDAEQLSAAHRLFWSRSNWQPLCKPCHDSIKQRIEKSGRLPGCDAQGRPLDPGHHWHRG